MIENGVVREFNMPNWHARPVPASIVIGPDSNPWFSDEAGPWIGSLEQRHGSWAEAGLEERRGPGEDGAEEIASGPLGDLWYTAGNRIGSLQPRGSFGALACTASGCDTPVNALVEGPDGNLWYASGISQGGGGSSVIAARYRAGTIEVFEPPPISARIKTRRTRLHGHRVTFMIRCTGGAGGGAADSAVEVRGRLAGRMRVLATRGYRCGPATDRQFGVPLGSAALAALRARGRLAVVVTMTFPGGKSVSRRILILPAANS